MNAKSMKAKGYGVRITGTFPTVPLTDSLIRAGNFFAYER